MHVREMSEILALIWIFQLLLQDAECSELCEKTTSDFSLSSGFTYSTSYEYCTWGCCESLLEDDPCCSGVGPIIGIVIAFIFVISFIITIICCCKKRTANQGRVMQPTNQAVVYNPVSQGQGTVIVPPPQTYPSYPTAGYQQPAPTGYHVQPQQPGYPAQPQQPGYPAQPQQPGYPAQPQQPGYPPYQAGGQAGYAVQHMPPAHQGGAQYSTDVPQGYPAESKASAPPLSELSYNPAPPPYSEVTK